MRPAPKDGSMDGWVEMAGGSMDVPDGECWEIHLPDGRAHAGEQLEMRIRWEHLV